MFSISFCEIASGVGDRRRERLKPNKETGHFNPESVLQCGALSKVEQVAYLGRVHRVPIIWTLLSEYGVNWIKAS
jgi:hypothetical protein